jgi:hypothetical protein
MASSGRFDPYLLCDLASLVEALLIGHAEVLPNESIVN